MHTSSSLTTALALLLAASALAACSTAPTPAPSATPAPDPGDGTAGTRGPRPAPAVPSGGNVQTIPASIPSDGSGDTGPAISDWLNGLPAGSVALFTAADTEGYRHGTDEPFATYRLANGGIDVNRTDLTLWGYGVELRIDTPGTTWSHAGIHFDANGELTVRGFELEGRNTKAGTTTAHDVGRQHGTGISIAGDTSVDVYDTWIHHTWSDGIFVAGWGDTDHAPYGFDWGYNLIELTGRYGMVINQNDSGTARVHHNIIRDTGLYLIGGEDQRLGTDQLVNVIVERNDLGTFSWHDTSEWLPTAISWVYDYWEPLPNVAEVGPVTIRDNRFTGGAAPATFARWGEHVILISQKGVVAGTGSDYHDWTVTGNDFSGVPAAQRSTAYWARIHNTRNVTLTDNVGLGPMADRYSTSGSSGVRVSGNQ